MSIKFINGTSKKDDARKLAVLHKQIKNLRIGLNEFDAPDEIKDSADRLIMHYSDQDKEDNNAR